MYTKGVLLIVVTLFLGGTSAMNDYGIHTCDTDEFAACSGYSGERYGQCMVLAELYCTTGHLPLLLQSESQGWTPEVVATGWGRIFNSSAPDYCSWYGVFCDGDGYVTRLNLSDVGMRADGFACMPALCTSPRLVSSLPESIGNLVRLEELRIGSVYPLDGLNLEMDRRCSLLDDELTFMYGQVRPGSSNNSISALPSNFSRLVNLKRLYMDNANLFMLDSDVLCPLTNLEELSLCGFGFKLKNETCFYGMRNLTKLDLGFSNSQEIPDLSALTQLTELSVKASHAKYFSDPNLTGLDNLTTLNIELNNLEELPVAINRLKKLEYLSVGLNEIRSLPSGFCANHPNLKQLDLSFNTGLHLPDDIGMCKNLTRLSIRGNLIGSIPSDITSLISLEVVEFEENDLYSFPIGLFSLPVIQVRLGSNPLGSFLAGIDSLSCSSVLFLDLAASGLTEVPKLLMPTLVDLRLNNNNVSQLPEDYFTPLIGLEVLKVSTNNLGALPTSLFDVPTIKAVVAHDNVLTSLPSSIGHAENLMILHVDRNRLVSLPEELSNLSTIALFRSSQNFLTSLPTGIGNIGRNSPGDWKVLMTFRYYPVLCGDLYDDLLARRFDVSYNRLTELPASMLNMTQTPCLCVFDVTSNQLTSLPALANYSGKSSFNGRSCSDYFGLTIYAGSNSLSELPANFLKDSIVYMLDLSSNELSELPEATIAAISTARIIGIDFSHNKISSLGSLNFPESCRLRKFLISDNKISDVPGSLRFCSTLVTLDISANPIKLIPMALFGDGFELTYQFPRVASVDLSNCEIENLQPCPTRQTEVARIGIGGLQTINVVASDPGSFTRVPVRLDLSGNPLHGDIGFFSSYVFQLRMRGTNIGSFHHYCPFEELDLSDSPHLKMFPDLLVKDLADYLTFQALSGARLRKLALYNTTASGTLVDFLCGTDMVFYQGLQEADFSGSHNITGGFPQCGDQLALTRFSVTDMGPEFSAHLSGPRPTSCLDRRNESFGLGAELIYSDEVTMSIDGSYSCPGVVLRVQPSSRVEVDPSYFNFEGCCCSAKYYGDLGEGGCHFCESPGICPVHGQRYPLPVPGYWSSSTPPFSAKRCRPLLGGGRTACNNIPTGWTETEWYEAHVSSDFVESTCDEGYEDVLCSRCSEGYYESGGRCRECPPASQLLGLWSFVALVLMFLFLYFVGYQETSSWPGKWRARRERVVKQRKLQLVAEMGLLNSEDKDGLGDAGRSEDAPKSLYVNPVAIFSPESSDAERSYQRRPLLGISTIVLHLQMLSIMTRIGAGVVGGASSTTEGVSFTSFRLGAPACLFPGFGFFENFIVSVAMPVWQFAGVFLMFFITFGPYLIYQIVFFVIGTLGSGMWTWYKHRDAPISDTILAIVERRKWAVTAPFRVFGFFVLRHLSILLFIYYQGYVSLCPPVLQALRCSWYHHDVDSWRFVMAAPYMKCDFSDGKYVTMFILAIVCLVFWIIGLPSFLLMLLVLDCNVVDFLRSQYREYPGSRFRKGFEFCQKLGMILRRDRDAWTRRTHIRSTVYSFWEVWKLALRFLVALILAMFEFSSALQPFCLMVLFFTAAVLQFWFHPFIRRYDSRSGLAKGRVTLANELELASLLITTVNFSVALGSRVPGAMDLAALGIFLVFLNVGFVLFGVFVVIQSPLFSHILTVLPLLAFRGALSLWKRWKEAAEGSSVTDDDAEEDEEMISKTPKGSSVSSEEDEDLAYKSVGDDGRVLILNE